MKKSLLLMLTLSSALALPQNQTLPPPVDLASLPTPPNSLIAEPVILLPALVIGVGVGVGGWVGIKIFNHLMRIREHQLTNAPADAIVFTLEPEDESGQ